MTITISTKDSRFARLEAIEWWDQKLLSRTRVLVIGAGALGNEVVKNLALLGIGHLAVADMDRVELSNLSRSVLFRESDEGKPKAECAARAAQGIFPEMKTHALVGNVLADLGLGWFRWADVVIGALDNREARVFVNQACARTGRPWFDGGIDVLQGVMRGFNPPATSCYECTMSAVDWDLLNRRRSCSLVARRAAAQQGTPTTPTIASIIAALQVQEVIKHLHGQGALLGRGLVFDGIGHASYVTSYPVAPDCPWHEPAPSIESRMNYDSSTTLRTIWQDAARQLGGLDAIDFSHEIVEQLSCPACRRLQPVFLPAHRISSEQLQCPKCGSECTASFLHSVTADSPHLNRQVSDIGLPAWDIVWPRHREAILGYEIAGDSPFVGAIPPAPS